MPVALVYNSISHVVVASPQQFDDFALGFSLSEGIITSPQEIYSIEIASFSQGYHVHIELSSRRSLAGRMGCGCGTEQLNDVVRLIASLPITQTCLLAGLDSTLQHFRDVQKIGDMTGCTHAAAWYVTCI